VKQGSLSPSRLPNHTPCSPALCFVGTPHLPHKRAGAWHYPAQAGPPGKSRQLPGTCGRL